VGLEPCAVAVAPDGKVWVVNHLSDSVSIVDVAASPPRVERTLLTGDEPRDIVFAGTGGVRAFVTTAHRGQHRTDASISAVPGAGDPQFTTEGIGRADVWVFDSTSLGNTIGGTPVEIMSFFADTPRALAVSPDGNTVYVAAHHSGNQSTSVPEQAVCDGFDPLTPCFLGGVLQVPGGVPGPDDNFAGASAPETGIIIQFNNASGNWEDALGRDWSPVIMFTLPDHDVFAVNANTLDVAGADEYDHVGTILFNMAVNPMTGNVYVSNTEMPNVTMFEGPGNHGGSTVQGHLSESRISVLSGTSTVAPRHLNKHIDYSRLHTDVPDLVDPTQKDHSLATPLEMVVTPDGSTLFVAAFGSSKIGVFDTAALENDSFDPTLTSANYIDTGGGPSGLVFDEVRDRLYVLTRFDNSVSVIDRVTKATLLTMPLHSPEPTSIVEGRPFLYDADLTSGNGEASCSSCHIFGDMDDLAWNLGNPDDPVTTNTQPSPVNTGSSSFHPMKGPMTTQTLRGLATHGALHWRGDRVDGHFGTDPCSDPTGSECNEEHSFNNFIVAFEGLVGRDGILSDPDMQKFTDFALQLLPPPNPVRNLDNSLTAEQSIGMTAYLKDNTDGSISCEFCHRLDASQGFFGAGGGENNEGEPQNFKIPHLRNMYAKVGMFGMLANPDGTVEGFKGEQVRGFGFLHDGIIDTLVHFVEAPAFNLTNAEEDALEQLMLVFDTDVAPIVGQQITLDATNAFVTDPRIDLLIARAGASFDSLTLGGTVTECDLIVKGSVGGSPRGWVYDPVGAFFDDDQGGTIDDASLRALSNTEGPLTYTCVPPGSGTRAGINRDGDVHLDGADNCADAANDVQTDTDADTQGDACDADDDGDGLLDFYETDTGVFVSSFETGSDPLLADSDGDGFDDGAEVLAGSDPNDPQSTPTPAVPVLPASGVVALCLSLGALAVRRAARLGRSGR
jgi:DNA-binding beta-propeller fold protein YncE